MKSKNPLVVLACLVLFCLEPLVCLGLDSGQGGNQLPGTSTMNAVIQKKEKAHKGPRMREGVDARTQVSVLINGSRYAVLPEATVVDSRGQAMTMDSLPVPCEATITYEPEKLADPGILRIELRRVLPGATAAWPPALPD